MHNWGHLKYTYLRNLRSLVSVGVYCHHPAAHDHSLKLAHYWCALRPYTHRMADSSKSFAAPTRASEARAATKPAVLRETHRPMNSSSFATAGLKRARDISKPVADAGLTTTRPAKLSRKENKEEEADDVGSVGSISDLAELQDDLRVDADDACSVTEGPITLDDIDEPSSKGAADQTADPAETSSATAARASADGEQLSSLSKSAVRNPKLDQLPLFTISDKRRLWGQSKRIVSG